MLCTVFAYDHLRFNTACLRAQPHLLLLPSPASDSFTFAGCRLRKNSFHAQTLDFTFWRAYCRVLSATLSMNCRRKSVRMPSQSIISMQTITNMGSMFVFSRHTLYTACLACSCVFKRNLATIMFAIAVRPVACSALRHHCRIAAPGSATLEHSLTIALAVLFLNFARRLANQLAQPSAVQSLL